MTEVIELNSYQLKLDGDMMLRQMYPFRAIFNHNRLANIKQEFVKHRMLFLYAKEDIEKG
jgi:hypothetical protein